MVALVIWGMRLHVRHQRRFVVGRWGLFIKGMCIDILEIIDCSILNNGESAVLHLWVTVAA